MGRVGEQLRNLTRRAARVLSPRREAELERLRRAPRYVPTTTTVLGPELITPDGPSFRSAYRAIFEQELYAFECDEPQPLIIDGGGNVGLAAIYFRLRFPRCRLVVFEPDPELFRCCESNLRSFGMEENVDLRRAALWSSDGTLTFHREGADGGSLTNASASRGQVTVRTQRLSEVLASLPGRVALLKLDIEGAETEVLRECRGELGRVDRLFVEYHSLLGREQTLDEVLAILRAAGLRVHAVPENHARRPFIDRPAAGGMDFQINIFAYR